MIEKGNNYQGEDRNKSEQAQGGLRRPNNNLGNSLKSFLSGDKSCFDDGRQIHRDNCHLLKKKDL